MQNISVPINKELNKEFAKKCLDKDTNKCEKIRCWIEMYVKGELK